MAWDAKDRNILYEIEINARDTYSSIGKRIRLSKETTNNRVERLVKKGIISGFNTLIDIAKLGLTGYAIFARFQNVSKEKREEIISYLKENKNIYWVAALGGKFDIIFAIQAKNVVEFDKYYSEILSKYGNFLKDNSISIRVKVNQFKRDYLVDKKTKDHSPFFGKEPKEVEIDDLDKEILRILSGNARIQTLEIAKITNKPRSTIQNRIKNLIKIGLIQGFSSLIHVEKYNYQIYQLLIYLKNFDEKSKRKIFSYCANNPNITFFVDCVGKWNIELTCEIKDQEHLQSILSELRSEFEDIISDVEPILTFNYYIKYQINV